MSTGGGWQDQVGGLTGGVKYITSRPGMKQHLNVEYLKLDEQTKQELQERFALIYTGQRRLARNLLLLCGWKLYWRQKRIRRSIRRDEAFGSDDAL